MQLLVNWLWQGTAISAAAAILLFAIRPLGARSRYVVLTSTLLTVLFLPFVPVLWDASRATAAAVVLPADPVVPLVSMPEPWISSGMLLALWAVWCLVFAVRLGLAGLALARAKRRCTPFDAAIEARLDCWNQARREGRPARLAVSRDVPSAAVLGITAPVIAVAPALLRELSDEDLDRVILHEWAHVQRRDDLATLIQHATTALAGWHPAVWWTGRSLQIEREAACDEIAIARTGSARDYALCLTRIATLAHTPVAPLPAPGVLTVSTLRSRVVRILALHRTVPARWMLGLTLTAASTIPALAFPLGAISIFESATDDLTSLAHSARVISAGLQQLVVPRAGLAIGQAAAIAPARKASAPRDVPAAQPPAVTPSIQPAVEPQPPPESASARRQTDSASHDSQPPSDTLPSHPVSTSLGSSTPPASEGLVPVWQLAADAGQAVGRSSKNAGVATGRFFSRIATNVAGSF